MSSNVASYKSIGLMAPLIYVNTDYNPQDVCETGRASQYVYVNSQKTTTNYLPVIMKYIL